MIMYWSKKIVGGRQFSNFFKNSRSFFTVSTRLTYNKKSYSKFPQNEESSLKDELPLGEKIRSLVESRKSGWLNTVNNRGPQGQQVPLFGSLMPYVLCENSTPIFALHANENHMKNLHSAPQCSLVVFPWTPQDLNPGKLPLARANLMGTCVRLEAADTEKYQRLYGIVHPGSLEYIRDCEYYRLVPEKAVLLDEGNTKIISYDEYEYAIIDPFARKQLELVKEINGFEDVNDSTSNKNHENAEKIKATCKVLGGMDVERGVVYHIDRFGVNILGEIEFNKWVDFRLPFGMEATKDEQCLDILNKTFNHAMGKYKK